jgi:hypothetical protein
MVLVVENATIITRMMIDIIQENVVVEIIKVDQGAL